MRSILAVGVCLALASGCLSGSARSFDTMAFRREPGWIAVDAVPVMRQEQEADCGAAAVAMELTYWHRPTQVRTVWDAAHPADGHGIQAGWLKAYLEQRGLTAYLVSGTAVDLERELRAGHPVLIGTMVGVDGKEKKDISHYEVVVGLNRERGEIVTLDPARGAIARKLEDFDKLWRPSENLMIVAWEGDRPVVR
jgi:ABC-type bacteriocin/lantibiotic exporter with double-glycine peptidase domain